MRGMWASRLVALGCMTVLMGSGCTRVNAVPDGADESPLPDAGPGACEGNTCSGHGDCAVVNGSTAVCVCNAGYRAEGLTCEPVVVGNECQGVQCNTGGTCAVAAGSPICACGPGFRNMGPTTCVPEADPCDGETCSGHGTCAVANLAALCVCNAGYRAAGLTCEPVVVGNECEGVECNTGGTCAVAGGSPICACGPGFRNMGPTSCVADVNPCDGQTCSGHGTCAVANQAALCVCASGYRPAGLTCEPVVVGNECNGIDCNAGGACAVSGGNPVCICGAGFEPLGPTACVPEVDPCEGTSCAGHGVCAISGGTSVCICDAGFFAVGLQCIPVVGCDNVECNRGGVCAVRNGAPECTCGSGFRPIGATTCVERDEPIIITQPVSARVALGAVATFSVTVTGLAPNYQWRKNGADIAGANARSFTTPPTVAGDNSARFSVVVTNSASSATSNDALLTVTTGAPVFTVQPADVTVTSPGHAFFRVLVSNATTVRWESSDDGVGFNSITFGDRVIDVGPTDATFDGRLFRVTAFNDAAPLGVTSDVARLTVLTPQTEAPTITSQPARTSGFFTVDPAPATFSVGVSGRPRPDVQWQQSDDGVTYVNIIGATELTMTTPPTTAAQNARRFRVVASNVAGVAVSQAVQLEIRAASGAPTIGRQPSPRAVPVGNSAIFEVGALGAGNLTFQWKKNGVNARNDANTLGVTTERLQIVQGRLADSGGRFQVVVTNAFGSVTSDEVTLLVNGPPSGVVSTIAGSATEGGSDGTGAAASFTTPGAMAADGAGNLYVTDGAYYDVATNPDGLNHTVRKVTPAGVVTTIAGRAGVIGNDDGDLGSATLDTPAGIAVSADGETLYVAESPSIASQGRGRDPSLPVLFRIRKIDLVANTMTTLAGGFPGSADGMGTVARFGEIGAIALDNTGNIIVADVGNHTIRRVTPGGLVTTIAGLAGVDSFTDGTGAGARFRQPRALLVDPQGNIIVGDGFVGLEDVPNVGLRLVVYAFLRQIDPAGVVTTLAGGGDRGNSAARDGFGRAAGFSPIRGIARDSAGNLYLTEGSSIRRVTPSLFVSQHAGYFGASREFADGPAATAKFDAPVGIVAAGGGVLFIADSGNSRIRRYVP